MIIKEILEKVGLQEGHHILLHGAFRSIKNEFPGLTIQELLNSLQEIITSEGSLLLPAFTYCFKRSQGEYEIFDRKLSTSKVGAISEIFRNTEGVNRTSSPTHSFLLWGQASKEIGITNNPKSPLGQDSPLDWLANQPDTYILLLGVNFQTMSFCHYLEVMAPVPWHNISPWDYMHVEKIGVSKNGEKELKEIPGCSKSFINFEKYLIDLDKIKPIKNNNLKVYYVKVADLLKEGLLYFKNFHENLLCAAGTCKACDERRSIYKKSSRN